MQMTQEDFRKLLEKYENGECSPQELKILETWYNAIPEQVGTEMDLSSATKDRLWNRIQRKESKQQTAWWDQPIVWRSAASLALIFVLAALLYYFFTDQPDSSSIDLKNRITSIASASDVEYVNNGNASQDIVLSDGSKVVLEPGSKLIAHDLVGKNTRDVFLQGEAFFKIAHNPQKPFLVYTHSLVTKVLGTSFTVNTKSTSKDVIVKVKTGKVAVFPLTSVSAKGEAPSSFITLTPNQQIVYNESDVHMNATLVEAPVPIEQEQSLVHMKFEEAPISSVFEALEKAYGVHIVYDKDKLSACVLNTTLTDENLYQRLEIVCKAIGATYEVNGTTIQISGRGC